MSINNTTLLGLAQPVTGQESGVWGDDVNNGLTELVEIAIAGVNNITQDSDITLAVSNGSNSSSFTSTATNSTVAQYSTLNCSGSRTAARNIIAPASSRTFVIINNTTGGYAITIKKSGGTGVSIVSGETAIVYYDAVTATDYVKVSSNTITSLVGILGTANGGTGLSTYTAGDLPYYASGTALSKLGIGSSGQILTSTGSAPQWSTLSGVAVTTFSAGTTGFTPSTATSGAVTLAGTLATTNGGTGLTSFTANGVVYASSTSALATGSALTFDGTTFGVNGSYGAMVLNGSSIGYSGSITFKRGGTAYGYLGLNENSGQLSIQSGQTGQSGYFITFGAGDGSEQMRLTSTGLGIGTSSPSTALTVNGALSSIGPSSIYGIYRRDTNAYVGGWYSASGTITLDSAGAGAALNIDTSGNLGLGVTPSAWWSAYKVLEMGALGNSIGAVNAGSQIQVSANAFQYGPGTYKYGQTGYAATLYSQSNGSHSWLTAPFGTAGNAITFTQAMTLDNSGNLGIGTTSPSTYGKFAVISTGTPTTAYASILSGVGTYNAGFESTLYIGSARTDILNNGSIAGYRIKTLSPNAGSAYLAFEAASSNPTSSSPPTTFTERMRIDSSGNVGIGTSSPSYALDVYTSVNNIAGARIQNASSSSGAYSSLWLDNDSAGIKSALIKNSSTNTGNVGTNSFYMYYNDTGLSGIYNASSSPITFSTNAAERARIDSSGRLLVGRTYSDSNGYYLQLDGTSGYQAGVLMTYSGVGSAAIWENSSGALTFGNDGASGTTERMHISSNGLLTAVFGSYADPSFVSSGSNGFQVVTSAYYNDNSAHQVAYIENSTGIINIRTGNLSSIPFYPNGGAGVAYQWTVLNPQLGTWLTGAGPTVNFTENSASPNSYSIVFNGGGGGFTVQRTGGSGAYSVYVQSFGTT